MQFWPHYTARGILGSRPGIAPAPLQWEAESCPLGRRGRPSGGPSRTVLPGRTLRPRSPGPPAAGATPTPPAGGCALTHRSGLAAPSCSSRRTDRPGTGSPRRSASRSGRCGARHAGSSRCLRGLRGRRVSGCRNADYPRPRLKSPLRQ